MQQLDQTTYVVSKDGTMIPASQVVLVTLTDNQAERMLEDLGDSERFDAALFIIRQGS